MNKETQLGYCCINLSLKPKNISVNHTCRKKTFLDNGLPYVSTLAIKNITSLIEIIKWNIHNNIKVYRMSSDMFPWMSEYEIKDLPDFNELSNLLSIVGKLAIDNNIRLSFHPGPFNVLGSPNLINVTKTTKELNQHAEIMDLMGLPQTREYPINIH